MNDRFAYDRWETMHPKCFGYLTADLRRIVYIPMDKRNYAEIDLNRIFDLQWFVQADVSCRMIVWVNPHWPPPTAPTVESMLRGETAHYQLVVKCHDLAFLERTAAKWEWNQKINQWILE